MEAEKRRENEDANGSDTRASVLMESRNTDISTQNVLVDAFHKQNTPSNPSNSDNRCSHSPSNAHQSTFSSSISAHSSGVSDTQSTTHHPSHQHSVEKPLKDAKRSPSSHQKEVSNTECDIPSITAQNAQATKFQVLQQERGQKQHQPVVLLPETKQMRQQIFDAEPSKSWKVLTQFPNSKNEIENLAHVCCRLALARTREDMSEAINRMSIWSKRSSDIALVKIALREFQLLLHANQKIFIELSSKELNVKWEHVMGRLKYLILQHANTNIETGKEALHQSSSYLNEAKRHAFEALKSKLMSAYTNATSTNSVPNVLTRDIPITQQHAIKQNGSLLQQSNVPMHLHKSHHSIVRNDIRKSDHIMSANATPSTWRPSSTVNMNHQHRNNPSVTKPAPKMEELFDVDLSSRSCKYAKEAEGRFYFPIKLISKVMRKAFDTTDTDDGALSSKDDTQEDTSPLKKKLKPCTDTSAINIDADAVALMQECVTEFILYLTSEAAGHAAMNKLRVNITGNDVVDGMKNLGFSSYASVLALLNEKLKVHQDDVSRKKLERKMQLKKEKEMLQAQQTPLQNGLPAIPHPPIRPGYMTTNPISFPSIYKDQQNLIRSFHGQYPNIPKIPSSTGSHPLHQTTPIHRIDANSKEQPRVIPTSMDKNFIQSSSTTDS
uniref:AlNc14C216G9012 protein n=1 Tax=Albugo laibachii Nc14 TaxID=890382 RepID=F0WRL1_9STRA|nr:AlNc14C216G9012 [Albugo laibachii Nc14]|eukprot:CCA23975.1 AlNc14C216G9012 [Albugo laibachii Nc14]